MFTAVSRNVAFSRPQGVTSTYQNPSIFESIMDGGKRLRKGIPTPGNNAYKSKTTKPPKVIHESVTMLDVNEDDESLSDS